MLLCAVTLLQFMEKAADRSATEQVVYHLRWKYALYLELDYDRFIPRVGLFSRPAGKEKSRADDF